MVNQVQSPCVAICQLDDDDLYCIGCYRLREEIAAWSQLTNQQKQDVLNKLPARRDSLAK